METYILISSIGIALDMIGVIVIFFFGIPTRMNTDGHLIIVTKEVSSKEIKVANRYKWLSWVGLLVVFIGFLLQLISNFVK